MKFTIQAIFFVFWLGMVIFVNTYPPIREKLQEKDLPTLTNIFHRAIDFLGTASPQQLVVIAICILIPTSAVIGKFLFGKKGKTQKYEETPNK